MTPQNIVEITPSPTLLALADLDRFQGKDADLLDAREASPEPIRFDQPRLMMPIRDKQPFDWNAAIAITAGSVKTVQFEKVKMACNGTVFMAWKSLSDGKIYL